MMLTVKQYFDKAETNAIFSGVLSDLKDYANFEGLTNDDVRNLIIEKYSNMYINGNPTIAGFSRAVIVWHNSRKYYFDGLLATTKLQYNPIHNVDETIIEETDRHPNIRKTETHDTTNELTHGHTVTNSDTVTGTGQVTTFDDSVNFDNDSKTTTTGNATVTNAGKDITEISDTIDSTEVGNELTQREYSRTGNIGVTSTQELIEQQRKILNIDILHIWVERFCERFFIPLYEFEKEF